MWSAERIESNKDAVTHVETKIAMTMRETEVTTGVVVIKLRRDRPATGRRAMDPCGVVLTCAHLRAGITGGTAPVRA